MTELIGTKFDLVVIGTGAAATTVASKCASAGWKVAIADSRPFGGTCALRGCDPKKVLVGAADVMDWVQRMKGKGIQGDQARIDWPELIRFKRSFTDPVPKNREADYAKAGIETFHDRAHFVGPTAVQVGRDILEGRYIVVATGATPRKMDIPGEEFLTTIEKFLELESLPECIVFIGGIHALGDQSVDIRRATAVSNASDDGSAERSGCLLRLESRQRCICLPR